MNEKILNTLKNLMIFYKADPTLKFKVKALNTAIDNISVYPKKITSGNDARQNIPSIGEGIANRIDEILKTGTLSELPDDFNTKNNNAIQDLTRISGIGEVKAKKLIQQGITSVEEYKQAIEEGKVESTHHIDVGLKYLDKIEEKVPRAKIKSIEKILQKEFDKNVIFNICGSYRRGKSESGDIDVLFTVNSQNVDATSVLPNLIDKLEQKKYLVDHITKNGKTKYMGIWKGGYRIDIRYVPYESYYYALLYFTGSKNFNINMRNRALSMGYSLSEYGIKKDKNFINFNVQSEEDIFKILEMDYIEPTDRNV